MYHGPRRDSKSVGRPCRGSQNRNRNGYLRRCRERPASAKGNSSPGSSERDLELYRGASHRANYPRIPSAYMKDIRLELGMAAPSLPPYI